jgi:peptidyl-prolyl cis-trans isomerase C
MNMKHIITILITAAWMLSSGCSNAERTSAGAQPAEQGEQPQGDAVVVTVNGAAIRDDQVIAEVDNRINVNKVRDAAKGLVFEESARPVMRDALRAEVVHALIERALIAGQLRADRIEITDAEVDARFAEKAGKAGQTPQQAEQQIKSQGRTLSDVKQRIRWNELGIEKLYAKHVTDKKDLSEADALKMYTEYPAEFDRPETRRVSHILIRANPDDSDQLKNSAQALGGFVIQRARRRPRLVHARHRLHARRRPLRQHGLCDGADRPDQRRRRNARWIPHHQTHRRQPRQATAL